MQSSEELASASASLEAKKRETLRERVTRENYLLVPRQSFPGVNWLSADVVGSL